MNVRNLAYLVIGSARPAEWEEFGRVNIGGMSVTDDAGNVLIRIDHYRYRLLVVPDTDERLVATGWATRNEAEYAAVRDHIEAEGVEVAEGDARECATRYVEAFFAFEDPAGNRHEVCWGRTVEGGPFVSPSGISHFVTGELGFGHVVLPCGKAYDESLDFYQRVLRFDYSDFFRMPSSFGGADGVEGRRVHFFHPENARQHSVAIGEVEVDAGIIHFALEVPGIDDVGRAMDSAAAQGNLVRSLGRHVNDENVSFYIRTPGGFHLEYGYDARLMDWDNHEVVNIPRGSYWGHQWQ